MNYYLNYLKRNNYSKNTIITYKNILKNYVLMLDDIRLIKKKILGYKDSPNTVWTHYNVLLSFMKFKKDKRLLKLKQINLPPIPIKYMPVFSKSYLINRTKDLTIYRNVIIRLLFETGLRASELKNIIEINSKTMIVKGGLLSKIEMGILAGYPIIDIKATLFDGSYHDVDSSEMAYKLAASKSLSNGKDKIGPVLLEPIMDISVTVPEEYFGDIMGDLSRRRGQIKENKINADGTQVIRSDVPLSEMFGYATDLRSMTSGRGNYQMQFNYYEKTPKNIQNKIIKKRGFGVTNNE